jgi:hypothetical protein
VVNNQLVGAATIAGNGTDHSGWHSSFALLGKDMLIAPRPRTRPRLGCQDRVHDDQGCDGRGERASLTALRDAYPENEKLYALNWRSVAFRRASSPQNALRDA